MYKKVNVVMLPSNEKAIINSIIYYPVNESLSFCTNDDLKFINNKDFKLTNNHCYPVHLYILSDEEIKEGDKSLLFIDGFDTMILTHFEPVKEGYEGKKIILTTDQDLIKDGVQAIDDEFLEWFVKNPGCEEIEVHHFGTCCGNQLVNHCIHCKKYNPVYKTIIPKEEPKKYPIGGYAPGSYYCKCITCNTMFMGDKRACQCEPCATKIDDFFTSFPSKQETLEEAAEKFRSENPGTMQGENNTKILNAFKKGAKWQAERMYSEEEVYKILLNYQSNYPYANNEIGLKKWFKQFKKK